MSPSRVALTTFISSPLQTSVVLGQYETEGIFRAHLAKYGIHVELGTEPTSLEQDASGVNVTMKKVTADEAVTTETARFPYVIGADGAKGV